jgi:hypothetical protein
MNPRIIKTKGDLAMKSLKTILVLTVAAMLLGMPALAGEKAPRLPEALVKMLPAEADMLIVVPSVDELEAAWEELRAGISRIEEDNDMPPFQELVADMHHNVYDNLDHDKPLAFALNVPNMMMGGGEMVWTGVLPWRGDLAEAQAMVEEMDPHHMQLIDGYLQVTAQAQDNPAEKPTPLVDFVQPGAVCLAMDLASIWEDYEPMMGFAMMGMTQPQYDPETGEPGDPPMTQDEAQAMADGLRQFFGSADVLALGLGLEDGAMRLVEEIHMLPGSALDPLPQPDFKQALELTRFLDDEADWAMAYAIEPGQFLELYKEMYGSLLADTYSNTGMMDQDASRKLVDTYFQAIDMYMAPTAVAIDLDAEKGRFNGTGIQINDQGHKMLEMQKSMIDLVNSSQDMLVIEPIKTIKIAGTEVHSWDYRWNEGALEQMIQSQAHQHGGAMDEDDREDMALVMQTMYGLMPRVSVAERDGMIFWSMGQDMDPMEDMLEAAKKKKGKPHQRLAKLAKQAGPHCQGVFDGDLGLAIATGLQIAREIAPEDVPALEMSPIPASYSLVIGETHVGVDFRLGFAGLLDFMAAMNEWDESNDHEHHHDHDHDHHHDHDKEHDH